MNHIYVPGKGDVETWGRCEQHYMDPRTEFDEDGNEYCTECGEPIDDCVCEDFDEQQ